VLGQVSLEIVKRGDTAKTFTVLPKRWIVERIPAFAGTGSSVGLTAAAGWPRIGNAKRQSIGVPALGFDPAYAHKALQNNKIIQDRLSAIWKSRRYRGKASGVR